jgi:hypothetical protein
MKLTLKAAALALCALASVAHAEGTLFAMQNKAGGEIRLTDIAKGCAPQSWRVYSTGSSSSSLTLGCWNYVAADNAVFIEWQNGKTSGFNASDFTTTPYGEAQSSPGRATKTY